MPARDFFHSLFRIGPVQIGTHRDSRTGRTRYAAVCTAENCGWSSGYASRTAATLAARTHRCRVV